MHNNSVNPTKAVTGPSTRWSYANVWDPKSINGGEPKYSACLLIPKSDTRTIQQLEAAIQAAYIEGQQKLRGKGGEVPRLEVLKTPLRDGDLEHPGDPVYAGMFFMNASSREAPGIVDLNRQPILQRSEVYSGVYGRASVSFYAYNVSGNRGIACALNHLQKCRDGAHLGTRSSAYDDFADASDLDDEENPF